MDRYKVSSRGQKICAMVLNNSQSGNYENENSAEISENHHDVQSEQALFEDITNTSNRYLQGMPSFNCLLCFLYIYKHNDLKCCMCSIFFFTLEIIHLNGIVR